MALFLDLALLEAVDTAHRRLKELGVDVNEKENLIALFTKQDHLEKAKEKLPDFEVRFGEWAATAVHDGHTAPYYSEIAERINSLDPSASKDDVLALLTNSSMRLKTGRSESMQDRLMDETLYKIEFGPPQTYYVDVENAQQDIYPFLLSDLPEKLAEEAERDRLDRRPWGIQTLIERGVNRVAWRQYATELLGSGLVSQRVADTYIPLTNGRISIDKSIEISSPGGNYLPYCWLSYAGAEEDPYFESVDVSRTPELAGCEDWRAISRRLREVARAGTSVPVWLPSRILEQPQLVNIGGFQARCVANELFVESWRNTEVSQTLREHPWEYDLHFEPIKMGGHHLRFFDE